MNKISCAYCDKTFGKPSRLDEHIRIHTGERPFVCDCGKSYARKQHLRRHKSQCFQSGCSEEIQSFIVKKASESNEKAYSCPQCSAGPFRKKKMVWAHIAIVHRERKHVCSTCDRTFPTLSKLKRHSKNHHGYVCDICSSMKSSIAGSEDLNEQIDLHFKTFIDLRRHIVQMHPKPPLQCSTCGKRFNRPSLLKKHEVTHTPGGLAARRMFVCPICSPNDLITHSTESETKDIEDSSTKNNIVAFTFKRNLDAHIRSVHADRKFPCTWRHCSVLLSSKQKLNQHLERHRLGKALADKSRSRSKKYRPNHNTNDLIEISFEKLNDDNDNWETASQSSILNLLKYPVDEQTIQ